MKRKPTLCGPQQKRRFSTERAANKALDAIWKKAIRGEQKSDTIPCRVYGPCKRCRGWHFTSQAAREDQFY